MPDPSSSIDQHHMFLRLTEYNCTYILFMPIHGAVVSALYCRCYICFSCKPATVSYTITNKGRGQTFSFPALGQNILDQPCQLSKKRVALNNTHPDQQYPSLGSLLAQKSLLTARYNRKLLSCIICCLLSSQGTHGHNNIYYVNKYKQIFLELVSLLQQTSTFYKI